MGPDPGIAAAQEFSGKDFRERQHHDAAERERRDEALDAKGDGPHWGRNNIFMKDMKE